MLFRSHTTANLLYFADIKSSISESSDLNILLGHFASKRKKERTVLSGRFSFHIMGEKEKLTDF